MSEIDHSKVAHVAKLARIEISPDQASEFAEQLSSILGHIDQIESADTQDVAPMTHPHDQTNFVAQDMCRPSTDRDQILKNAPKQDGEFYQVPPVI